MTGFSVSGTLTSNVHVEIFPELSVTVHRTVLIPGLKTNPSSVVPVPDVEPDTL